MKMLVFECAERRGPHPGFAHLLPFASLTGEGDNLTKLLPSPVLRSHGEAGWERVPDRSAVCKQTAEVRAGGSRCWCRKMLNQRALLRASLTFSHSLRSRAKAEIFKHIALSRPAQPWRSRMGEGARMVSGLQTNRRGEGWWMKMVVFEHSSLRSQPIAGMTGIPELR